MIAELAPDPAIGANAVHLAIRKGVPHIGFVDKARGHQRAGRARLYAFAAGDAGRSTHGIIEVEHDLLAVAAPGHSDHVVDLHLAASANTQIAMNAGVETYAQRGMAAIRRYRRPAGKPAYGHLLAMGWLQEFRPRIMGDLPRPLVGQGQLDHHLSR